VLKSLIGCVRNWYAAEAVVTPAFPSQDHQRKLSRVFRSVDWRASSFLPRRMCWQKSSFEDGSSIFAGVMTGMTAILPETVGKSRGLSPWGSGDSRIDFLNWIEGSMAPPQR
jgi:hypothetical protein